MEWSSSVRQKKKQRKTCIFPLIEDTQRREEFSRFIVVTLCWNVQEHFTCDIASSASQMEEAKKKKKNIWKTCWDDNPLLHWHWMLFKLFMRRNRFPSVFFAVTTNRFQMHCRGKRKKKNHHLELPMPILVNMIEFSIRNLPNLQFRFCHAHKHMNRDPNLRALFSLIFFLLLLRCRLSDNFEDLILDIFISVWFCFQWAKA